VKLVIGDANAKVGRETVHQPTKQSLQESTNENGLRLVDFAAGRQITIKNTYFMHKRIHLRPWHSPDGHTFNQIDHWLIDERHFYDVMDVMARRGANIDSDHMLACKKLEETIQRVAKNPIGYTRKQANKEWFDKECAKVNEEKNAVRERAIQNSIRGAKNAYKLPWTKEALLQKNGKAARRRGFDRE
jgi:hypothetical protein